MGGGGKTNISLQESSEEWALGSKTSAMKDRTQRLGEKKRGTGHLIKKEILERSILVTWFSILCYINCKNLSQHVCLERKIVQLSLDRFAEGPKMT